MQIVARATLAVALLLVSGCSSVRAGAAPAPEPASPLLRHCPAGSSGRMQCLERALLDTLEVEGISAAMVTLERIGAADAEIRRDGHVYAHVIGLAAYREPERVGASFAACTPAFQSGCYHGVIQSYFVDLARGGGELRAEQVNALCADYRSGEGGFWLLFQCAHGMGHGLTMVRQYHLPSALEACDLVESPWERDACYGGVFMESIINATAPHHTTGRPQQGEGGERTAQGGHGEHGHGGHTAPAAADEHAGHDPHAGHHGGGGAAQREPFPALDPADHQYPCSALAERYKPACYMMQTSVVMQLTRGSFAAAARMCDEAPEAYRTICYQSLGRDVSASAVQDHRRALRLCEVGDPALRSWCHVGYVKNVIDVTADPDDGLVYCRMLPAGEAKERCYRAVGQQLWVLAGDQDARRGEVCAGVETGYVSACREGANLPPEESAAP